MSAPERHWFRRGFWWREYESLRCGLFNVRHPWRLTRGEWLGHRKLFLMNIAAIAGAGALIFCVGAIFVGINAAPFAMLVMLALAMGWLTGRSGERKRSPLWPRDHRDATHGSGAPPRIQGTAVAPRRGRR